MMSEDKLRSNNTKWRQYQRTLKTSTDQRYKSYLFWWTNDHKNFAKPELEALLKLFHLPTNILQEGFWYGPMGILSFETEEDVKKILSRSILIRSCYEIWAFGESLEAVHRDLKSNLEVIRPYENSRFRIRVENFAKKISQEDKLAIIDAFDYIPMQGPIDLSNPECSVHVIQYYKRDTNDQAEIPDTVFLGRWIGDGQMKIVSKISLKERKFIGNTSMDPLLSLIMANLALTEQNSVVFDPFVGTGSILIAAAAMGGYVIGTDIDYLMLHGKTKPTKARVNTRAVDESVFANFRQYKMESSFLDVVIADTSLPLFRTDVKLDAIITDPPYGVREAIERIGSEKEDCTVPRKHLENHYPQKVPHSLSDIFIDLLDFSAHHLNLHGRLVSWIPVLRHEYKANHLPRHDCLQLVANCEQVLSENYGRRLLVYEKIAEPKENSKAIMESDSLMYKFRLLLEKSSDDNCKKTTSSKSKVTQNLPK